MAAPFAKCLGPEASDNATMQRLIEHCLREKRAALLWLDEIRDARLRQAVLDEAQRQHGLRG